MKSSILEKDVQRAITDYLKAEKIPCWRMNSGDRFGSYNGKKWRIKGHEPGTPDLLAAPEVTLGDSIGCSGFLTRAYLWIEVKRPGGKQSVEQKNFEQFCKEHDMLYIVATSVDEVRDFVKSL